MVLGGGFLAAVGLLFLVSALQSNDLHERREAISLVGLAVLLFGAVGWRWRQSAQDVVTAIGTQRYQDQAFPGWSIPASGQVALDRTRLRDAVRAYDASLPAGDATRLGHVVQSMGVRLGSLDVEEAYWILVPPTGEPAIEAAMGGAASPGGRMPHQVVFDPSDRVLAQLSQRMGSMEWVLHVHNHPRISADMPFAPSAEDQGYTEWWKGAVPQAAGRMKFFVIDEARVLEYGFGGECWRIWKI